jgi:hypothetical protein
MYVYAAAVYSNNARKGGGVYDKMNEQEQHDCDNVQHILESYHYVKKQSFVDVMRQDRAQVFLDSGAFSAYTLGVELKVSEYCAYIKRNIDLIRKEDGVLIASVLDGIGDPLETYKNQQEMEARGVTPLPCFHAGEDERYLELYVRKYPYITLGGMVGSSNKQLQIWLDRVWDRYLVDGSGRPKLKVHGFGITSIPIMERYPWWSCDSSSWVQTAAFGAIMHPLYGNINISENNPAKHDLGEHVNTLSPQEKEFVCNMLLEQGYSYERLSTCYQSRFAYNLWAYGEMERNLSAKPEVFKDAVQELF